MVWGSYLTGRQNSCPPYASFMKTIGSGNDGHGSGQTEMKHQNINSEKVNRKLCTDFKISFQIKDARSLFKEKNIMRIISKKNLTRIALALAAIALAAEAAWIGWWTAIHLATSQ